MKVKLKTLEILEPSLKKDFVQVPTRVLHNPKLSMQAKCLYSTLISYAWYNAECFPGQDRLATDLGVTVKTIRTYLVELKKHKLLGWEQRGLNRTNLYKLLQIPPTFDCYERKIPEGKETTYQEGNPTTIQEGNSTTYKVYEDKVYKGKIYKVYEDEDVVSTTHKSPSLVGNTFNQTKRDISSTVESAIKVYLDTYKEKIGKKHPVLKLEQITRIENELENFESNYLRDSYDNLLSVWKLLIHSHFKRELNTNYNINHFASSTILVNGYYNAVNEGSLVYV